MKTLTLEFDTRGNDKQKQVAKYWVDKTTEEILYGGAKYSGKSFLGCNLIFGNAFMYAGTHYFIARKTLSDLKKFTIPSIHEVFRYWGITENMYNFNSQDYVFTLYNGSKIYLIEAKDLPSDPLFDRFGSMQMTQGWIEEGQEFSSSAKANLSATCGRWRNQEYGIPAKLLITCNPAKNFLYTEFYDPSKKGVLPKNRAFVQAYPQDNKAGDEKYIERLRNTLDANQQERLLKGNWDYDNDPAIMVGFDAISDLYTNPSILSNGDPAELYYRPDGLVDFTKVRRSEFAISCDVARYGQDKTVIMLWYGLKVIGIWAYDKTSVPKVAEEVKAIERKYNVPRSRVVVDDDGVGGGVSDLLRGCKRFNANARPHGKKDLNNFQNLKTQCQYKLADLINARSLGIDTDNQAIQDLINQELGQLKTKDADKDGKLKTIPKDEIKTLIGRSPDFLDTLTMRMVFEVLPVAKFSV